ncbi:MAG: phosphatidylserine decarboxylase [Candidatus Woesearchaeota archaeon]
MPAYITAAWIIGTLLGLALLILVFYRFYFLRKPVRTIPPERVVVSPAYGKVVKILKIGKGAKDNTLLKKGILGKVKLLTKDTIRAGYLIVIMMTPFDVHYQRSPVQGTVVNVQHHKGKFLNAVKDAGSLAALENEKNEILIHNNDIGKVKVVQVAGFLARRIECFTKKNHKVLKGENIGLIKLGSQVILVIPELKLCIKEGQRVIDGETPIARF